MNCAESQKLVYVYFELEQQEQERVRTHCEHCSECNALLDEVQAQRESILGAFAEIPLEYPSALSASIMRAVESKQKIKKPANYHGLFFALQLRHVMAGISFALAAFFIYETASSPPMNRERPAPMTGNVVVLNSSAFMKRIAASGGDEVSAIDCWRNCRPDRTARDCKQCIDKLNKENI